MRILIVGPTGRTGRHLLAALEASGSDAEVRGFCRYPEHPSRSLEVLPCALGESTLRHRSIEVVPGNDGGTRRDRSIEVIPGNDGGTRRDRSIEVVPGNDGGTRRDRSIEVIPGNDGGTRRDRSIEVIPGNDGGTRRDRSIEVIPGNDGGTRRERSIEVIPGNDGGTRRERSIEVVPGNSEGSTSSSTRSFEIVSEDSAVRSTGARAIEIVPGNLENPDDRAAAVAGMDVVIHYAPAFHPREAAMGTGMIDAAVAAGVMKFIYVSALQPQIDPAFGGKRAVESYLAASGLAWTVLRPQRYMQNIDARAVLAEGSLRLPIPAGARIGQVDMADLAEAAVTVALEDGHDAASYDIASDESLSLAELAAIIAQAGSSAVACGELSLADLAEDLLAAGASRFEVEAAPRCYDDQALRSSRGNGNHLRWLLGREPATFKDYVARSLGQAQPG